MEKFIWDEQFEWLEQEALTDMEFGSLSVEEKVARERALSQFLEAYKGRFVLIKNQTIVTSGATLAELTSRGGETWQQLVSGSDGYPMHVPEQRTVSFFYKAT